MRWGRPGPGGAAAVIEKTTAKSGDEQTGPIELALGNPLRVLITREGAPVEGVDVDWEAGQGGSISDETESDEDGIATAVWTLGPKMGNQAATAEIDDADGLAADLHRDRHRRDWTASRTHH